MKIQSFLVKSVALGALTLAVAVGALGSTPAEAKHKHHKKFGVHLMLGAPLVYGGYGYGYHGYKSCHWLYHKAKNTGSKYWWKRYYDCKYD